MKKAFLPRLARHLAVFTSLCFLSANSYAADGPGRWPVEKANAWLKEYGWLRGANFLPSTAINQLDMWQESTFDPITIDRELGYAESLGFNSMRVFLHDLPWQQDSEGFSKRIEQFLKICDKHKIKPLMVLFDSCWYPLPYPGPQMGPLPYTHNSGWVQSPGVAALQAEGEYPRLRAYVTGVIKRFAKDKRIVGWDVWNEPDNFDGGSPKRPDLEPKNKVELVNKLLPQVFIWAREANPVQPLTSGVWHGDIRTDENLAPTARIQLENSDIISFHNYSEAPVLIREIGELSRFGRPLMCTEYMARANGSFFEPQLGDMKARNVAAYNWGFVSGKSQTIYPWDSWKKDYTSEPPLWFHDILRIDGSAYRQGEVDYIRKTTGVIK